MGYIEVVHPDPRRGMVMYVFRALYGMVVRPCNFNPLLFSSPAAQGLSEYGKLASRIVICQTKTYEKIPRRKPEFTRRDW